MKRTKRSPKALDAMFDKYLSMRREGKPSQEINLALNLPEKYEVKFLKRILAEGHLDVLRQQPKYQIVFGKMSLSEISNQVFGASSQVNGKEQVWKVENADDGLILTPYYIVPANPETEATACDGHLETDVAASGEIPDQSN